ncbi:hypothetical protein ACJIZ3_018077 [Penstemon smallii]|uniref:Uncharacterized protein n=1 Tax=Penstemon smallii TaxID=265156 RepID=A0ABD3SXU2_9LAMI
MSKASKYCFNRHKKSSTSCAFRLSDFIIGLHVDLLEPLEFIVDQCLQDPHVVLELIKSVTWYTLRTIFAYLDTYMPRYLCYIYFSTKFQAEQGFYFVGRHLSILLNQKFQQLIGETAAYRFVTLVDVSPSHFLHSFMKPPQLSCMFRLSQAIFENQNVLQQLHRGLYVNNPGVMEAIRIISSGYPTERFLQLKRYTGDELSWEIRSLRGQVAALKRYPCNCLLKRFLDYDQFNPVLLGQSRTDPRSDPGPSKHWMNRLDKKDEKISIDAAARGFYDGFSETQTDSQVVGYEEYLSGRQMIIDRVRSTNNSMGTNGKLKMIENDVNVFFPSYAIVYQLRVTQHDKSIMVYGLSWLVIVAVMLILKIVSMGRKKFSADFQLMFRLLKLFLLIGFIVTLIIFIRFLELTAGDTFASLLASCRLIWQACRPIVKALGMWGSVKALARGYEYLMGLVIFGPIAVLAWFPFVYEFQTRLLFNQAFSRRLQIQRILAGGKKHK